MRRWADLRPRQLDAIDWLLANPASALWADMGEGKTAISLAVAAEFYMRQRILILAPIKVATQTWPSEIPEWSFSCGFQHTLLRADNDAEIQAEILDCRRLVRLRGGSAEEAYRLSASYATSLRQKKRIAMARDDAPIHIINHEAAEWLLRVHGPGGWPYEIVFIDESSYYKDHTVKRFKALFHARSKIKRLHQLTASPAPEGYMGLFTQALLMDEGRAFGRKITHFRRTYFDYDPFSQKYEMKPGADRHIEEAIAPLVRIQKTDRPETTRVMSRAFDLTADEQERYDEMEKESIITLFNGEQITADSTSAANMKLVQLASGATYDKNGKTHFFHSHKFEILAELLVEAQGSPMLIAYWFKSTLQELKRRHPDAIVMDKAGSQVDAWNRGEIPKLLVQPRSTSHGLNMQHGPGHTLTYFDNPWPLDPYQQLIGRLDRSGQRNTVNVYHITARGTIDETIVRSLRRKQHVERTLFKRLQDIHRRVRNG